jgi:hypothetical protein
MLVQMARKYNSGKRKRRAINAFPEDGDSAVASDSCSSSIGSQTKRAKNRRSSRTTAPPNGSSNQSSCGTSVLSKEVELFTDQTLPIDECVPSHACLQSSGTNSGSAVDLTVDERYQQFDFSAWDNTVMEPLPGKYNLMIPHKSKNGDVHPDFKIVETGVTISMSATYVGKGGMRKTYLASVTPTNFVVDYDGTFSTTNVSGAPFGTPTRVVNSTCKEAVVVAKQFRDFDRPTIDAQILLEAHKREASAAFTARRILTAFKMRYKDGNYGLI